MIKKLTLRLFLFLTILGASAIQSHAFAQVTCSYQLVKYQHDSQEIVVRITASTDNDDYLLFLEGGGNMPRTSAKASPEGTENKLKVEGLEEGKSYRVGVRVVGDNTCKAVDNVSFTYEAADSNSNQDQNNSRNNTNNPDQDDDTSDSGVVSTALGNISTNPTDLVNTLLTIAIGVAGGVAFLLIIYGGFRLAFAQGDPKAVQEARDIITSAIVGLLLIVFSVFLLNLIGVDILGLPIGDSLE